MNVMCLGGSEEESKGKDKLRRGEKSIDESQKFIMTTRRKGSKSTYYLLNMVTAEMPQPRSQIF